MHRRVHSLLVVGDNPRAHNLVLARSPSPPSHKFRKTHPCTKTCQHPCHRSVVCAAIGDQVGGGGGNQNNLLDCDEETLDVCLYQSRLNG
jgi:hypothetical protein